MLTHDPKNLKELSGMKDFIAMDVSMNDLLSKFTDEAIKSCRERIISGEHSQDEMNKLLDDLQDMTVKKHDMETRMKHGKEIIHELEELEKLENDHVDDNHD